MPNLEIIKEKLIQKGFPELQNKKIVIEFNPQFTDGLLEYDRLGENEYYIQINELLLQAPEEALEGGLAHEFAHILTELKMSLAASKLETIRYKFSRKYRALDERETDLLALLRGYGYHLFQLCQFSRSLGRPETEDNGLTMKELEHLLKLSATISVQN